MDWNIPFQIILAQNQFVVFELAIAESSKSMPYSTEYYVLKAYKLQMEFQGQVKEVRQEIV